MLFDCVIANYSISFPFAVYYIKKTCADSRSLVVAAADSKTKVVDRIIIWKNDSPVCDANMPYEIFFLAYETCRNSVCFEFIGE